MVVRALFLGFALSLAVHVARAEVPRETLERIALIRVETAELRHLVKTSKLTNQEFNRRTDALKQKERALWEPYRKESRDEILKARTTIEGLAKARLSLLESRWRKEQQATKEAAEDKKKELAEAVEEDARSAVEFQRERLVLKRQLESGAIGRESFAEKDRAAVSAIADLRKKYETAGGMWPQTFDQRLALLTRALDDKPETVLPQAQVPPPKAEEAAAPDFDADVRLAAGILVQRQENLFKLDRKEISGDIWREANKAHDTDLSRLRARYQAISPERADEFRNAYNRLAEPQIHALRVKYFPDKYALPQPRPQPTGGGSAGDWAQPDSSDSGWSVVIFVIFFLSGAGGLWWLMTRRSEGGETLSGNYGTAAWADHRLKPLSGDEISRGVTFGKSGSPGLALEAVGAPVTSTPEAHTLIVARTRAGKGTRVIMPTLLRYSGSMLVIDPKGENAAVTARARRDHLGQTVYIVNPWGEMAGLYERLGFHPATFNPLDAIDRRDPNAVAVAQSLAAIICPPSTGKEQYWQGSAANVLTGVFLWLADQPGEEKTLARARQIVTMSRGDFLDIIVKMAASTAYRGAISEMVSQYIDLAPETYSAIMSNLAENTKFLSDPRVKAATAASSFDLKTLREVLATVYLVIPHDRIQTHATWLRLVIAAAMQGLKSRKDAGAPHHRCMFLIDEFGSMGRIDDIPRDIALMSGYGLDFTLVVQGLDQLKDHYGDARGTILSNCAYKWFCFVNDLDTAKYLSESLGRKTVRTVGESHSSGSNPGGPSHTSGTSYGEMGRPLLMPDEILNLGREVAVLLNPHGAPYYLRPVDYWKLPETYAHLKDEYPQFYWNPPLEYDENPYFKKPPPPSRPGMSEQEAREILGVAADASPDDIRSAYKRLMLKVHPDTGGSNYMARQLNEAKAALLGE